MPKPRYLTKSVFKLALECPAKLYYVKKTDRYPDVKADDPFLEALAEGGFQVGELARRYYPGGINIGAMEHEEAIRLTNEALKRDEVVIYEAAIRYGNFFIRADILEKRGNVLRLIEVKAKSYDSRDVYGMVNHHGYLKPGWIPYVYDVAFQKHVAMNALPGYHVRAFLMLADKTAAASVDGLNQQFFLGRDPEGRVFISTPPHIGRADLGEKILVEVPVDDLCEDVFNDQATAVPPDPQRPFSQWLHYLSEKYRLDEKIITPISMACKDCEFRCDAGQEKQGLISGFKECWKHQLHWTDTDFRQPMIFDIWDFRRKAALLEQGKYFMKDVTDEDLNLQPGIPQQFHRTVRQRIQIDKAIRNDPTPCFELEGLHREVESWRFPLHFIDFETTAVAIPFHKGLRPYEGIAFQFSHHMVHANGFIEHKGQYLNDQRGAFPNFYFIRTLKKELDQDEGTIFRYATHENTYLNFIYTQLIASQEPDRNELCDWIRTITTSSGSQPEEWEGQRNMVDMCRAVRLYHYDPFTNGSNSIKKVLPAILNSSSFLKDKYSAPVYGTPAMPSLNFTAQRWISICDGKVASPYSLLEPVFKDVSDDLLDSFITDEDLADGGAAMMAYARMQFTEMTETERQLVKKGLFRYCELDTLAMVMLWEYWYRDILHLA